MNQLDRLQRNSRFRFFAVGAATIALAASLALAQNNGNGAAEPAPEPAGMVRITNLFLESFDVFTILLIIASLVGWTVFFLCLYEIRRGRIVSSLIEEAARECAAKGSWQELRTLVDEDNTFLSNVLRKCMSHPGDGRDSLRNAGELAASEECARIFRLVEPMNVVGNLGPLLGLAGTVWGMVIAFAALGQTGGEATPANLSVGISKALFHTLLGLLVALPALAGFGFFRARADRLCNRAMIVASELVDLLPDIAAVRRGPKSRPGAAQPSASARP
ncbi:MAG TPA: MotA/TolQ/ExbB proton channel family protein [Phycisphaerales bacterium]|nr:MotA/TolQ/ExbB proton channel family protein [Phycisphaerales bacterium]